MFWIVIVIIAALSALTFIIAPPLIRRWERDQPIREAQRRGYQEDGELAVLVWLREHR